MFRFVLKGRVGLCIYVCNLAVYVHWAFFKPNILARVYIIALLDNAK